MSRTRFDAIKGTAREDSMSTRRPKHDRPIFTFNVTMEAPDPDDFVQHEPGDDYDG